MVAMTPLPSLGLGRSCARFSGKMIRLRAASCAPRCFSSSSFFSKEEQKGVGLGNVTPLDTSVIPSHLGIPPYAQGEPIPPMPGLPPYFLPPDEVKSGQGEMVGKLRRACRIAAEALEFAGTLVKPGVKTEDIDTQVFEYLLARDAYPSPLGYMNFTRAISTSVNEVVCHGVPDDRELEEGDVVSVDVSCFVDGVHGDNCATFPVGKVDSATEDLIRISLECLDKSIAVCGPGVPLTEIGRVCSEICDSSGYSSVREFCGHGVGEYFHQLPYIYHFTNAVDNGKMEPGMVFTIEPIIVDGRSAAIKTLEDDWTCVTRNYARAAQFEHQLYITETGVEVMTVPEGKAWEAP